MLNPVEEMALDGHLVPVALAAALSLAIIGLAWLSRHRYLSLPALPRPSAPVDEDHVVVIPARNEERNIERAVKSFPGSLVVVVDDHSDDRTAAVATAAGAAVRTAQPLAKGAMGKASACWSGALYTESKWILFADADTWYEPEFLQSALGLARREDLIALTVFPRPEYGSPLERILLPYVSGLSFAGVNAMKVNSARAPQALANGQCMLVRRDAYEFVKGHESVIQSVAEDVALARIFKRHRMPVRAMRAERLAYARAYGSFRSMWQGFDRNPLRFLQGDRMAAAWAIATSFVMAAWGPATWWLASQDYLWLAALVALAPVAGWMPWYRSRAWALAAPLAVYLFPAIAIPGLIKSLFGFRPVWKGRRV